MTTTPPPPVLTDHSRIGDHARPVLARWWRVNSSWSGRRGWSTVYGLVRGACEEFLVWGRACQQFLVWSKMDQPPSHEQKVTSENITFPHTMCMVGNKCYMLHWCLEKLTWSGGFTYRTSSTQIYQFHNLLPMSIFYTHKLLKNTVFSQENKPPLNYE